MRKKPRNRRNPRNVVTRTTLQMRIIKGKQPNQNLKKKCIPKDIFLILKEKKTKNLKITVIENAKKKEEKK